MLKFCGKTNFCKSSFVLTAGFGETEAGKVYEKELRELFINSEHIANGGNTLGYIWNNVINTSFVTHLKSS